MCQNSGDSHVAAVNDTREMEEQERKAYLRHPQNPKEIDLWANAASWPEP